MAADAAHGIVTAQLELGRGATGTGCARRRDGHERTSERALSRARLHRVVAPAAAAGTGPRVRRQRGGIGRRAQAGSGKTNGVPHERAGVRRGSDARAVLSRAQPALHHLLEARGESRRSKMKCINEVVKWSRTERTASILM